MKRKKLTLVAVSLALGFGAAAGAARSGLLGALAIGGKGHPAASGIHVHGKWSLVVRSRHGKVVARRRFENALTPSGAAVLASIISGQLVNGTQGAYRAPATVGGQGVLLEDNSTSGTGCRLLFTTNLCEIVHNDGYGSGEPDIVPDEGNATGYLHETVSGSTITLSGQVTPPVPVTVRQVQTLLKTCDYTTEADDCGPETSPNGTTDHDILRWQTFTAKTLSQPLPIAGGQSVTVTVQLSFS